MKIKAAALKLARLRPVADIPLEDCLHEAGVSRQGFYRHFRTFDAAVVEALADELRFRYSQASDARIDLETPARMASISRFAAEHAAAIRHLRGSRGHFAFVAAISEVMGPSAERFATAVVDRRRPEVDPARLQRTIAHVTRVFTGGTVALIDHLVDDQAGCRDPDSWAAEAWASWITFIAPDLVSADSGVADQS